FLAESCQANFLHDYPQQMFDLYGAPICDAVLPEDFIDAFEEYGVLLESPIRGRHDTLAGSTDGHDIQSQLFGLGKRPRIQRQLDLGLGLTDHTRTAARGCR